MKNFDGPTCNDNFISTVTCMNETTTLQLSTVVDNGLIHGC